MKFRDLIRAGGIVVTLSLGLVMQGQPSERLEAAAEHLSQGRGYYKGFRGKLPDDLVADFLGETGRNPSYLSLQRALSELAIYRDESIRAGDSPDPSYYLLNESLEAMLYGFLSAGNRDLLNGTRLDFPGAVGLTEQRRPRIGPLEDLLERRNSLNSLEYSRLYFLQGILRSVDSIRSDPDGRLRAADRFFFSTFPLFTRWNQAGYTPDQVDADYANPDDQTSMTASALLGKVLKRYAGTVATSSKKLWRAAYYDPALQRESQQRRDEALQFASSNLRKAAHTQFLASLPLAATIDDGASNEGNNDYQDSGLHRVQAGAAGGLDLMRRINSGERPRDISMVPRWDKQAIEDQMAKVASLKANVEKAWIDAEKAIQEYRQIKQLQSGDRIDLRSRFEFRLWQISGIHPTDSNYSLKDEEMTEGGNPGRVEYLEDVRSEVQRLIDQFDINDPAFSARLRDRVDPGALADGSLAQSITADFNERNVSELAFAVLRLMQAIGELRSTQNQMNEVPVQISREKDKTGRISSIQREGALWLGAMDAVEALAASIETSVGLTGTKVITKPGQWVKAANSVARRVFQADQSIEISEVETEHRVSTLVSEQSRLSDQIVILVAQTEQARAEIQRLLAEVEQILGDYAYHVGELDERWYYDPELTYEKTKEESRYEDFVRAYQIQLYLLAKMLEKSWIEPYGFPAVEGRNGSFAEDTSYVSNPEENQRFPDAESVFSIADHRLADAFLVGLRDWDKYMRDHRLPATARQAPRTVSLRQHIRGLSDLVWNADLRRFENAPDSVRRDNVRKFRSWVLKQKQEAEDNSLAFEFRADFAFDLSRRIAEPGAEGALFIFPSASNTAIWNRRITHVGIEFRGDNVSQGSLQTAGLVSAATDLALHGRIHRKGWLFKTINQLDGKFQVVNLSESENLSKFQTDPYDLVESNRQFHVTGLNVAVNGRELVDTDPAVVQALPHPWPLACDQVVLLIRRGSAQINYENLTDIVLRLHIESGQPPRYDWTRAGIQSGGL